MKSIMTKEENLEIIIALGKLMIANGAETYRVEDTIARVAQSKGIANCDVFVIPTGFFISFQNRYNQVQTVLKRVHSITINLEIIDLANQFARDFVENHAMSYTEAKQKVFDIAQAPQYRTITKLLLSSLAGGFFVLMFGGNVFEVGVAYLTSLFMLVILDKINYNFFIKNLIGGFLAAFFATIIGKLFVLAKIAVSLDVVIIGPLMLLVPGVAITVGIKDIISGELVAGSAKMTEALFTAVAIAVGVGVMLFVFSF